MVKILFCNHCNQFRGLKRKQLFYGKEKKKGKTSNKENSDKESSDKKKVLFY